VLTIRDKCKSFLLVVSLITPLSSHAFLLEFTASDFVRTTVFSEVTTFDFVIDVDGPLASGVYDNPSINFVDYEVNGSLAPGTPSGFPAFALKRPENGQVLSGAEFYAQGSSLNFEISATADLSDGLQVSELVGTDRVFVFNGREIDTGRYHPALFELNSDGSGRIQNSNNQSVVLNPATNQAVNVNFGDEYITDLSFDPAQLTLAAPVPVPPAIVLLGSCALFLARRRTKKLNP